MAQIEFQMGHPRLAPRWGVPDVVDTDEDAPDWLLDGGAPD